MNYNELSEKEMYYINEAKRIGAEKGDCEELRNLCKKAHADCTAKIISAKAYNTIYGICVEYAYPR